MPHTTAFDDAARLLAAAPVSRRRALGLAGATVAGLALGRPERASASASAACGCPPNTTCCSSWEPCCATVEQGVVCISNYLCCQPGKKVCFGTTDPHAACCDPGDPCYVYPDGSGGCKPPGCPSGQMVCGSICCPVGQECVEPSTGLCCDTTRQSVCSPNNANAFCCDPPTDCRAQSNRLDGFGPAPPNSLVCCPPERQTKQYDLCCMPGTLATAGLGPGGIDLCCPPAALTPKGYCCSFADKGSFACGDENCCNPLVWDSYGGVVCKNGQCQFKVASMNATSGTVDKLGDVPVPINFNGPADGTVTIQTVPRAPRGASIAAAGAGRPVVLGRAHFHVSGRGRKVIRVPLSQRGRRVLGRRRKLKVEVVISVTKRGKTHSATIPYTIRAHR